MSRPSRPIIATAGCLALLGVLQQAAATPASPAALSGAKEKAVIVFRFDDVGAYPSQDGDRALNLDKTIFAAFAQSGLPLVAGVVPCFMESGGTAVVPPEGWSEEEPEWTRWLRRCCLTQGVEIAQHGLTHQPATGGAKSEFRGLPRELQQERILFGKRYLEERFDRKVYTFIPPWNAYDENTLEVLKALRFECISDDWKGPLEGAVGGLCRLPQTATLEQLSEVLDHYPRIPPGSLIVVLFHRSDLRLGEGLGEGRSMERFRGLLNRVAGRDDLVCATLSEVASRGRPELTSQKARAARRYVAWASFVRGLPGFDPPVRDRRPGVLFPESYHHTLQTRIVLVCGLVLLGVLTLGGWLGRRVNRVSMRLGPPHIRRWVLGLILVAAAALGTDFAIRMVTGRAVGVRWVCAWVFTAGFGLAWLVSIRTGSQVTMAERASRKRSPEPNRDREGDPEGDQGGSRKGNRSLKRTDFDPETGPLPYGRGSEKAFGTRTETGEPA